MKIAIVLCLLLLISFVGFAQAQSPQTKITRIEVDQEEIKTSYKVLFLLNGNWIEAEITKDGFIVPPELKGQEKFTIRFIFGIHDLEFNDLAGSAIGSDLVVGVDLEPYSDEYVKPEEAKGVISVYYLSFRGTVQLVTIRSSAD